MQLPQDFAKHILGMGKNDIVPEMQHEIALRRQIGIALSIARRLPLMLPAIRLHDEAGFKAGKVGDIAAKRMLAAKLEPAQPAVAQVKP